MLIQRFFLFLLSSIAAFVNVPWLLGDRVYFKLENSIGYVMRITGLTGIFRYIWSRANHSYGHRTQDIGRGYTHCSFCESSDCFLAVSLSATCNFETCSLWLVHRLHSFRCVSPNKEVNCRKTRMSLAPALVSPFRAEVTSKQCPNDLHSLLEASGVASDAFSMCCKGVA